jgi:hypothetical protein
MRDTAATLAISGVTSLRLTRISDLWSFSAISKQEIPKCPGSRDDLHLGAASRIPFEHEGTFALRRSPAQNSTS